VEWSGEKRREEKRSGVERNSAKRNVTCPRLVADTTSHHRGRATHINCPNSNRIILTSNLPTQTTKESEFVKESRALYVGRRGL